MSYSEIIARNPVRFFYKYCASKGVRRKREETLLELLAQLKLDQPGNEASLQAFLATIDGSTNSSFVVVTTQTPLPTLSSVLSRFQPTPSPIETKSLVQCTAVKLTGSTLIASYSVFKGYLAIGPGSTIPNFDLYTVTAESASSFIRIEGNLSFLTGVIGSFMSSLGIATYETVKFSDVDFEALKVAIESDNDTYDLKILRFEKKVLTGNVVDTLGFKSRGKMDLQEFMTGSGASQGQFIDTLSTIISSSGSETVLDEQKYCFDFEVFPEVKIEVILSVNRKGIFSLNCVPRSVYDFIGKLASTI